MDWKRLQQFKCPKCSHALKENSMGYDCTECGFTISYEKFMSLINGMMMPKKQKYDPDKIDRSGWEI